VSTVLVLNTGSSSIKYRLLDMDGPAVLASGLLERIGEDTSRLTHRPADAEPVVDETRVADHEGGLERIMAALGEGLKLTAVGHRVVHGGNRFAGPALLDDDAVDAIRALVPLAPLHNPSNLAGIRVARARFPGVAQVAVFDTAFHQTMPPRAARYALPPELAERRHIRRYGFHGTSHGYVARRAAEHLGRPLEDLALVTLHLGNGASAAAIQGGRSIDTSMGLTPLAGLVMGTRSGDLDPAVLLYLQREEGLDVDQLDDLLNRGSGLRGLTGDNDLRAVEQRAAQGDPVADEALDLYCYRIRQYVGAYAVALGRIDGLVFTAGVGEHSATVRARVCNGLGLLGIALHPARNAAAGDGPRAISSDASAVPVLVVPTDEELEIARQALALVTGGVGAPGG